MKLHRLLTPGSLKLGLVVAPLVLFSLYLWLLAADRFVSESVISVRQPGQSASTGIGAALMLGFANPALREDTLYLRQYIHSLDLLHRLDEELGLRAHYSRAAADLAFRLPEGATQEEFLEYYRARVETLFDDLSGLLTVRVQGFEPVFAQALNAAILKESERFVNAYSQRMAREQLEFAESELARAATRIEEAQSRLLKFQTANRLLDPTAQAQASGSLTAELQSMLTKLEAELRDALSYLNEDSHQVKALRSRIAALRAQIDVERLRGTSGRNGSRLNALAVEFQGLQLQVSVAQDAYKVALAAVENARIDATRKLKSLVVVDNPSLPEEALYPRRVYNLLTLFVVCCLIYAIARMVVATVRDHQD